MTDQRQRNADIAKSVEHALNQKDIDRREWEAQSKQWESVVIAQRGQLDDAHAALTAAGVVDGGTLGHRVRLLAAREGGR